MEAKPLPIDCPICHCEVDGTLREHLLDHEKEALVREIVANIEAEEQNERSE